MFDWWKTAVLHYMRADRQWAPGHVKITGAIYF